MFHGGQDPVRFVGLPVREVVTTSIFVQIPAYRDHELTQTVADAIEKASGSVRLHFGVHNCVLPGDNIVIDRNLPAWVKLSVAESVAPANIGLQMGRYIANSFYGGEGYYLQCDAHMRFVPDWDTKLIAMIEAYRQAGIPKPLISMYPPTYTLTANGEAVLHSNPDFYPTRISFAENPGQFTQTLIPSQTATATDEGCVYTASVSGGFIFADGNFAEIAPNRLIAFWGEEVLIAARAFTHGFDLCTATSDILFHLYHSSQPFELTRRHHVWNDFPSEFAELDMRSKAELQRIFAGKVIGEGALGSARDLDDYGRFSGLDFKTRTVTQAWK